MDNKPKCRMCSSEDIRQGQGRILWCGNCHSREIVNGDSFVFKPRNKPESIHQVISNGIEKMKQEVKNSKPRKTKTKTFEEKQETRRKQAGELKKDLKSISRMDARRYVRDKKDIETRHSNKYPTCAIMDYPTIISIRYLDSISIHNNGQSSIIYKNDPNMGMDTSKLNNRDREYIETVLKDNSKQFMFIDKMTISEKMKFLKKANFDINSNNLLQLKLLSVLATDIHNFAREMYMLDIKYNKMLKDIDSNNKILTKIENLTYSNRRKIVRTVEDYTE